MNIQIDGIDGIDWIDGIDELSIFYKINVFKAR